MSKRLGDMDAAPQSKRQKPNGVPAENVQPVESARQLQLLLSFQQDSVQQLRGGIKAFKAFLESILYAPDKTSTARQQSILNDYLESQTPKHVEESEPTSLPSLMQAWSFAAQANNDSVLSAIPAVLALLLKTISGLIDFRDHGLRLCRTLLQNSQLKLISRALAAPKQKEHLISPCLRLLTEIVAFDGGTLAKKVFAAKMYTLDGKFLTRNLSLWKVASEDPSEARRRPAVRSNAVRYLLALLRLLSSSGKSELLKYANVIRALFEHLKHDPVDVMKDVLDTVKTCVLTDDSIPRSIKGHVLNDHHLGYIASIYKQDKPEDEAQKPELQPEKMAHSFLLFVCSESRAGLLRPFAGWYPPGTDKDHTEGEQEDEVAEIDLGLDSVEWYNRYQTNVPIRNVTLARFGHTLRPHANILECELLLKIFESAPELVAEYFFKKSSFAFDPKLTATWIGYSSFLFSAAQLSVPAYFGRKDGYTKIPPPASVVVESILPQPLNQKVLTRCLNQQVELITFFTVRLICVAFQKLRAVLSQFREASKTEGSLWHEGATRVIEEFTRRYPKMKDVIGTFRKTRPDNMVQREAVLRLIALYYEMTPQAALEEKFDISAALAEALKLFEDEKENPTKVLDGDSPDKTDQSRLELLSLSHLLHIAHRTPDMRWWHKPESLKLSPFMTLLKMVVKMGHEGIPEDMYSLLDSIMKENGILQQETDVPTLHALVASLTPYKDWFPSDAADDFIDDAFARVVRKPIKYEDDFASLSNELGRKKKIGPVSLLLMTLAEQWSFAAERSDRSGNIAFWLGRFLFMCIEIGEDEQVVKRIIDGMGKAAKQDRDTILLIEHVPKDLLEDISSLQLPSDFKEIQQDGTEDEAMAQEQPTIDFSAFAPPQEDPKHRGLHRWSTKDIPSAVADGDLSSLILCLSSFFPEVRTLALANLRQFSSNLEAIKSTYPDAQQIYLLLGLLINTVKPLITRSPNGPAHRNASPSADDAMDDEDQERASNNPVPYHCTIYATLALQILQNPLHPLYPKINTFHTRSPTWDIPRLPSYWTHQTLLTPPTPSYTTDPAPSSTTTAPPPASNTDTTTTAIPTPPQTPHAFLLTYIYASLRTPADLALLRARGTFEPLFALAGHPFLPRELLLLTLQIVARATAIEGGSTVLVTRKGVVAWLGGLIRKREGGAGRGEGLLAVEKEKKKKKKEEEKMGEEGVADLATVAGMKALLRRVWETCDRDYVDRWSEGAMSGVVADLVGV